MSFRPSLPSSAPTQMPTRLHTVLAVGFDRVKNKSFTPSIGAPTEGKRTRYEQTEDRLESKGVYGTQKVLEEVTGLLSKDDSGYSPENLKRAHEILELQKRLLEMELAASKLTVKTNESAVQYMLETERKVNILVAVEQVLKNSDLEDRELALYRRFYKRQVFNFVTTLFGTAVVTSIDVGGKKLPAITYIDFEMKPPFNPILVVKQGDDYIVTNPEGYWRYVGSVFSGSWKWLPGTAPSEEDEEMDMPQYR